MYTLDNIEDFFKNIQNTLTPLLARETNKETFNTDTPKELESKLKLDIQDEMLSAEEVFTRIEQVIKATPSSSNPRFLNQLFGGREAIAISADIVSLFSNSSMYTFKAAGAQVLVENEVLKHLCKAAGFHDGEGTFMPGGSLSNLGAMVLARNKTFPESRDNGLGNAKPTLYTSEESHYSIRKSMGMIGIGRNATRFIPVDKNGSMNIAKLEESILADIANGHTPFFINATAGTTVRGAFDSIDSISEVAKKYNLWLHVDGALGASLLLSSNHKKLLKGISDADSLSWNPHKMMGLALQTSVLLTKRKGELRGSFDEVADYLFQTDSDEYNPGHRSLLCGRKNDAFRLWATWSHLGNQGWEKRLNWQMTLAESAAKSIDAHPKLELFEWPSSINVCFNVKGHDPKEICATLNQSGRLKVGYGAIAGSNYIRLVCINPSLTIEDLHWIFDEIVSASE
jgi:sulfinoalanine decarboxylase